MDLASALPHSTHAQISSRKAMSSESASAGVNKSEEPVRNVNQADSDNLVGVVVSNPNITVTPPVQAQDQLDKSTGHSSGNTVHSGVSAPATHNPRLDIDEKAIAAVEQLGILDASLVNQVSGNSQPVVASSPSSQQSGNTSGYDQPSEQNQTAVSAYHRVSSHEQRESVQQVFGVDLFA